MGRVSWFPVRLVPCRRRASLDDCVVVGNQSDRMSGAVMRI